LAIRLITSIEVINGPIARAQKPWIKIFIISVDEVDMDANDIAYVNCQVINGTKKYRLQRGIDYLENYFAGSLIN